MNPPGNDGSIVLRKMPPARLLDDFTLSSLKKSSLSVVFGRDDDDVPGDVA